MSCVSGEAAPTSLPSPPWDWTRSTPSCSTAAAYAEFYAWPQPWGDGGGHQELSARAEELTDAQCAPVFERALTGPERAELATLLQAAATRAATPA